MIRPNDYSYCVGIIRNNFLWQELPPSALRAASPARGGSDDKPAKAMWYWSIIEIIIEEMTMTTMFNPPHPGEVLREWLVDITVTEAARRLGVTRVTLSRVLNGATGISPDMDLRPSKALNTTPGTWYGMQHNYDMWHAQRRFRAKVKPIITRAA